MNLKKIVFVIIALLLTACSINQNVTTIGVEDLRAHLEGNLKTQMLFKSLDSVVITSEKMIKGEIVINAEYRYTTVSAKIEAKAKIIYVKNAKDWYISKIEPKIESIKPTIVSDESLARDVVLSDSGPYFNQAFEYLFFQEKLELISTKTISSVETEYVFEYKDQQSIWSFDQTFTVSAHYDLQKEWSYTLSDWQMNESTGWAGKWQVKLYDIDNKLISVIDDLVITGNLSVTESMSKGRVVQNTLKADFSLNGVTASDKPLIVDKFGQTNVIVIKTGSGKNDWFWMGLGIAGPVVPQNTYFYSVGSQNGGDLVKIN